MTLLNKKNEGNIEDSKKSSNISKEVSTKLPVRDDFIDLDIKLPPIKKGLDPKQLRLISVNDLRALHKAIYNPSNNKEIIDAITIVESAIANNKIVQ